MADADNKANYGNTEGEEIPTADYSRAAIGPGGKIGPYKLLRILGEGGYGIVYLAEQTHPVKRRIALKVIKPGMDTKQVIARFEAERQALALLDHPNIAHVFNAGTTQVGRPYFAMEYVKGIPVTEHCDRYKLTIEERLKLFLSVCEAVQHAHQKAIIHRDIKPSNILVAYEGEKAVPMIIDFGVAKALTQSLTERTLVTERTQMIGTPEYMSPEQAEMTSQDIDTRTDIYSLGVLLYELLTGTLPFDPKSLREGGPEQMRRMLREQDPQTPSVRLRTVEKNESLSLARHRHTDIHTLGHRLHGELDWITLKAMEKDRTRRYQTAHALAEDIQRYLNEEPVLAGPPGTIYKFQKFVKRNKALVSSVSAVAVILVLATFISLSQMVRANRAAQAARVEKERAVQAEEIAKKERNRAQTQEIATRQRAYAAEMNIAYQALEKNNLARALELLKLQRPGPGEGDLRGFEWRYLWQQCRSDDMQCFHDGRRCQVAFSPDGRYLAQAGEDPVIVRDLISGGQVTRLPGYAHSVCFSPGGDYLVTAGWQVQVWDTKNWRPVRTLQGYDYYSSAISPDGRWLVTGTTDGYQIWDTETWTQEDCCPVEIASRDAPWILRNSLSFSPDGRLLLTPGYSRKEGRFFQVREFPSLEPLDGFTDRVGWAAAFLPDGKHLLVSRYEGKINVWDIDKRKVFKTVRGHADMVIIIVPAPDGRTFFTAGVDSSIAIWDSSTWQPLRRLRGHLTPVMGLAISPNGQTLASCTWEGDSTTTRLWDAKADDNHQEIKGTDLVLGFTRDSRLLAAANRQGAVLWNTVTNDTRDIVMPGMDKIDSNRVDKDNGIPLAFNGPGEILLMGSSEGTVELWDLTTESQVAAWSESADSAVTAVGLSSNGELMAAADRDGGVTIRDVTTRRKVDRFRVDLEGEPIWCLAFSPDNRYLAVSGRADHVWVRDIIEQGIMCTLDTPTNYVYSVSFSPDGCLLAAAIAQTGAVCLWDIPSGEQKAVLQGNRGASSVNFAPDGKSLAVTGGDEVKIWNLTTMQEVAVFLFEGHISFMAFSPDGRNLAVGYWSLDGARIRLLHAPSFEEIDKAEESSLRRQRADSGK